MASPLDSSSCPPQPYDTLEINPLTPDARSSPLSTTNSYSETSSSYPDVSLPSFRPPYIVALGRRKEQTFLTFRPQPSSYSTPRFFHPNLLMPVSSADSPPFSVDLRPRHPSHSLSEDTSSQGTSSSARSKMYHHHWAQPFPMPSQPVGTISPMAACETAVAPHLLGSYMEDQRRTPLPPEPYVNQFTVAVGTGSGSVQSDNYAEVSHHVYHEQPMAVRDATPASLDEYRRQSVSVANPLFGRIQQGYVCAGPSDDHSPRSRSPTPYNPHHPCHPRCRKSRRSSRRQTVSRRKAPQAENPEDEHKNCFGSEDPPPLKNNCTEEQRCVFESRWKNRYQKGRNMWDNIQSDVERAMNKSYNKETLQMIFTRGRQDCYDWHLRDVSLTQTPHIVARRLHTDQQCPFFLQLEILRQAWIQVERERYQQLRDKFLELGGSRNMCLSPNDIEAKVVDDLKLEQNVYVDDFKEVNLRRRRRPGGPKEKGTLDQIGGKST